MSDLSYEEWNKKIVDDSNLYGEIHIPKPIMYLCVADSWNIALYKKPNFFHRWMMTLFFGWKFTK